MCMLIVVRGYSMGIRSVFYNEITMGSDPFKLKNPRSGKLAPAAAIHLEVGMVARKI